jgi:hypothetical protein
VTHDILITGGTIVDGIGRDAFAGFPEGAGRYVQRSRGYDTTLVNGEVFMERGEHAGAFAGRTLRSTAQ